jgi:hypothetical protein
MTIDEFYAHVQEHGFNGYSPSKADVMGDCWARKIGEEFDRVAAELPRTQFRHTVWLVWQWLYCELAGMRSRVIASPPAIRAAGIDVGPDVVSKACELLLASAD